VLGDKGVPATHVPTLGARFTILDSNATNVHPHIPAAFAASQAPTASQRSRTAHLLILSTCYFNIRPHCSARFNAFLNNATVSLTNDLWVDDAVVKLMLNRTNYV